LKKLKKAAVIAIFVLGFASAKGVELFESTWGLNIFPSSALAPIESLLGKLKNKKPAVFETKIEPALHREEKIKGYEVCFTPPRGCAELIVKTIEKARKNIFLQAYGFSHPEIAKALVEAKQRGVEVKVLLDRSNLSQNYSKMKDLQKAGIEVKIDKVPGIAHNKVMILDEKIVITGSFNFTKNADNSNAENVLIVESKDIAQKYLTNWFLRSRKAEEQKT